MLSLPARVFLSRLLQITFAIGILLTLPACWVYSVEPLYEEHLAKPDPDLLMDQTLVGDWGRMQDNCLWTMTIGAEERSYTLTFAPAPDCNSEEKPSRYEAHLVKLGSQRYFDVFPQSDDVCGLCLPLHSFLLVSQQNDALTLIPLNYDWMKKGFKEKRFTLPILKSPEGKTPETQGDQLILRASSKQLKSFLRQHGASRLAFPPDSDDVIRYTRR